MKEIETLERIINDLREQLKTITDFNQELFTASTINDLCKIREFVLDNMYATEEVQILRHRVRTLEHTNDAIVDSIEIMLKDIKETKL